MKREAPSSGDSFDLFLDTVCNAFGGIVFLAILIALMTKIRHDPSGSEYAEMPVTAVAMQALEFELQQQHHRLANLQTLREQLPAPPVTEQAVNLSDLSDEMKDLAADEQQLIKQRSEMGEQLVKIARETASLPSRIEESEKRFEEVTIQLASAKANWEVVQKQKSQTMQVPRERSGQGARGIVLLSRGELFLVCSPDDEHGEFFDRHVASKPIRGSNGYEILPRYGKGLSLGGEKSIAAIRGTAQRLSREGGTLIIVAYPDSYQHFGPVRDAFKSFGMSYELWVQADGEPLQVFYGAGRGRVQ